MNNMLMSAIGAMMRGENPTDFLKNLARTNPQLQGMNFDDLEGTATDLCNKNNVDIESAKSKITDFAKSFIN